MARAEAMPAPPSGARFDWRAVMWQVLLVAAVVWLGYAAFDNARDNMEARNIPADFSFWNKTSGFDINQSLVSYSAASTYGRAFLVGLLNTLAVALAGTVFATLIGFTVGVARLSGNWIVSRLAAAYVELLRNTPLLLQLLFWYNAVLKPLPRPRQSIALPLVTVQFPGIGTLALTGAALAAGMVLFRRSRSGGSSFTALESAGGSLLIGAGLLIFLFGTSLFGVADTGSWAGLLEFAKGNYAFLNNRGLYLPLPVFADAMTWVWGALACGTLAAFAFHVWARKRQEATGEQLPQLWIALALIFVPAFVAYVLAGQPVGFDLPKPRGFNLAGGVRIYPEFFALLLGLSLYTAAFIAEVVRAGILAVPKGQSEAGAALGLRQKSILKLIVVPQAMRVIVPPLTNQYLNLTKNSSLAVFVGYPDLVQVFAGTVLNQTGAAVQVIAITMAVYLLISLVTSVSMNLYNRRVALVER
ncbi:MAG: amino acid ABC transporter permease [Beijerinckiaceae bacterium]